MRARPTPVAEYCWDSDRDRQEQMSRRNKGSARKRSAHGHPGSKANPMTPQKVQRIEEILQRMKLDLDRSTRICESHGRDLLNDERDEFWALVKYVENVQEGIVQLDNINKTIFPRLVEFPETSQHDSETSWKSLKGMRSRLAHAYDSIDHEILWSTATVDFPRLSSLLRLLQFIRQDRGNISFGFKAGLWRTLPRVEPGEPLAAGNSIPCILFEESGDAVCVRIGREADNKMTLQTSKGSVNIEGITLVDPDDPTSVEHLWTPKRAS